MFKCLVTNHNEKIYIHIYVYIFVAQQKLTLYKSTIFQIINIKKLYLQVESKKVRIHFKETFLSRRFEMLGKSSSFHGNI